MKALDITGNPEISKKIEMGLYKLFNENYKEYLTLIQNSLSKDVTVGGVIIDAEHMYTMLKTIVSCTANRKGYGGILTKTRTTRNAIKRMPEHKASK